MSSALKNFRNSSGDAQTWAITSFRQPAPDEKSVTKKNQHPRGPIRGPITRYIKRGSAVESQIATNLLRYAFSLEAFEATKPAKRLTFSTRYLNLAQPIELEWRALTSIIPEVITRCPKCLPFLPVRFTSKGAWVYPVRKM
jgi:hypothetical protein